MIIGISGKIGSGKDTVGKIIQYLVLKQNHKDDQFSYTCNDGINRTVNQLTFDNFIEHNTNLLVFKTWQVKKFADTLKDIVCLLIGCTREQLEDHEFKNTELGEEWNKWLVQDNDPDGYSRMYYTSLLEAQKSIEDDGENEFFYKPTIHLIKLTPRLLLQILGTECGRNIIHPNIWVNSLFSKYDSNERWIKQIGEQESKDKGLSSYNWIITDLRFPNELEAIKKRKGISIRVNRTYSKEPIYIQGEELSGTSRHDWEQARPQHESETALDNATFDYIIDNSGTIEDLVEKVKEILIKENILCQ